MTAADVVATLSSPLDSFKIINTGATIGAFTEDRASAISGVLGLRARMIPFHITIDAPTGKREIRVSIIDLPSLTPQAMEVVLYNSLIQANDSTGLELSPPGHHRSRWLRPFAHRRLVHSR